MQKTRHVGGQGREMPSRAPVLSSEPVSQALRCVDMNVLNVLHSSLTTHRLLFDEWLNTPPHTHTYTRCSPSLPARRTTALHSRWVPLGSHARPLSSTHTQQQVCVVCLLLVCPAV